MSKAEKRKRKILKERKNNLKNVRKWIYSLEGIRAQQEEFGYESRITGEPIKYYPVVNEFESMDAYDAYIDSLIHTVKMELSNSMKGLSRLTIAFKFNMQDNLMEMNFIRFMFNIIMWRPWVKSGIPVTKDDIFKPQVFHNKRYAQFFDAFADKYRDRFTMAALSEIYYEIQIFMNKIAVEIGPLFGNSMSVYDMIKLAKRNKEINDILNTEIDPTMQTQEIEDFLRGQTDRFFNLIIAEDSRNNPLKPMMRTGVGVSKHQVSQTFINRGFIPDIHGHTLPITTNSSFIGEGLNTPESIFADSKGGLKAAVMQLGVAESGYYGRHSSFATSDVVLNHDPNYACDTVNLNVVTIKTKSDLESKEGQFYKVNDKRFRVVSVTDTHLIGKTLEFRSPATCANKENKICKACYGTLYNVNVNSHAGLYASIENNESKTQLGLSAKHVLATASSYVELIDELGLLTTPNGWLYTINPKVDVKKYVLTIAPHDVLMSNPDDYDKWDNYMVSKFIVKNTESGETFEIYDAQDSHMYLGKQVFEYLKDKRFFNLEPDEIIEVPLKKMNTDDPFTFIRIKNTELTKPIKELASFLQKGKKQFEDVKDYSAFIKKLNDLYKASSMKVPSVHIEMIIRNLIRNKKNPLELPDWSKPQDPKDIMMVSLNSAVLLTNSVILGLMFEKVKSQLKNPMTYQKTGTSIYSMLFINE